MYQSNAVVVTGVTAFGDTVKGYAADRDPNSVAYIHGPYGMQAVRLYMMLPTTIDEVERLADERFAAVRA